MTLLQRFHDTVAHTKNAMDMDAMDMDAMEARMAAMEAMDTDEAAIDNSEHRTPVIIDTDVDTDDQMAIAFLLAQPDIKVLAITVGCNGWSQQWAGVMSIMRLTKCFVQTFPWHSRPCTTPTHN